MLSGHCHTEAHAATPETAPQHHDRCAGAYAQPSGVIITCPCPRHAGEQRCRVCRHDHTVAEDFDPAGRQCADHDSCARRISTAHHESPARQAIKEARATITPRKAARDCECACGGQTRGGRFMPGHDAKLKSILLARARAGDDAARDDLRRRGWEKKSG
jgi:hypothetical protein